MEEDKMGFERLYKNLIDIIKEEQAKLGFRREAIRLYYPLSSLNHFFETEYSEEEMLNKLQEPEKVWDMVVVGGGATGLGVAVDAATRGYSVVLLEMADFAKSTSSRSTKLVHGGVRYLQKGDVPILYQPQKRIMQRTTSVTLK